ncbi:hypothetical protein [Campylobacter pinnipediorum]|uniref:hypothetical protein n=1 Tax=Campylobacter pinnipediorum TaxID=1965231 RepID=UPI00112FCFD8|nr:hypothetical protein [Campylobacter pinnipediorum]
MDIVLLMASNSLLDEVNQMLDKGIVDLAFSKNEHIVNKKYITKEKNIFLFKPDEIAVVDIKKDNNKIKITSKKDSLLDYKEDDYVRKLSLYYDNKIDMFLNEEIGITKAELDTDRTLVRTKENMSIQILQL